MGYIIYTSDDAAQAAAIHAECFPDAWSEESFRALMAGQGVEARFIQDVALLLTRSVADEMEVLTIAVKPDARRMGHARGLMQAALVAAKESGIRQCFLEVDAGNVAAIGCYEALGFAVISTRKNYYQTDAGKSDALVMRYAW